MPLKEKYAVTDDYTDSLLHPLSDIAGRYQIRHLDRIIRAAMTGPLAYDDRFWLLSTIQGTWQPKEEPAEVLPDSDLVELCVNTLRIMRIAERLKQ